MNGLIKINKDLLKLYLVTDRYLCGKRGPIDTVKQAVMGGVTCVQLRDKDCTTNELIRYGKHIKEFLDQKNIPLIVNDNLEAAIQIGASGIHVGQSDMKVSDIRAIIGSSMIVGLSCENLEQAKLVDNRDVDYVGVSPLFTTPTKHNHSTPLGMQGLSDMVELLDLPCVAIGGIKVAHCREIFSRGASGVAVISAICGQPSPEMAARRFRNEIKSFEKDPND